MVMFPAYKPGESDAFLSLLATAPSFTQLPEASLCHFS